MCSQASKQTSRATNLRQTKARPHTKGSSLLKKHLLVVGTLPSHPRRKRDFTAGGKIELEPGEMLPSCWKSMVRGLDVGDPLALRIYCRGRKFTLELPPQQQHRGGFRNAREWGLMLGSLFCAEYWLHFHVEEETHRMYMQRQKREVDRRFSCYWMSLPSAKKSWYNWKNADKLNWIRFI